MVKSGHGICAALFCENNEHKLKPWKREICLTHLCEKRYCECGRPFKLFFFPSELRNGDKRQLWVRAMNRINADNTEWKPKYNDRVCSDHFVDGEPSLANPNPSVNLGTQLGVKQRQREKPSKLGKRKRNYKTQRMELQQTYDANPMADPGVLDNLYANPIPETILTSDHDYCVSPHTHASAVLFHPVDTVVLFTNPQFFN